MATYFFLAAALCFATAALTASPALFVLGAANLANAATFGGGEEE